MRPVTEAVVTALDVRNVGPSAAQVLRHPSLRETAFQALPAKVVSEGQRVRELGFTLEQVELHRLAADPNDPPVVVRGNHALPQGNRVYLTGIGYLRLNGSVTFLFCDRGLGWLKDRHVGRHLPDGLRGFPEAQGDQSPACVLNRARGDAGPLGDGADRREALALVLQELGHGDRDRPFSLGDLALEQQAIGVLDQGGDPVVRPRSATPVALSWPTPDGVFDKALAASSNERPRFHLSILQGPSPPGISFGAAEVSMLLEQREGRFGVAARFGEAPRQEGIAPVDDEPALVLRP